MVVCGKYNNPLQNITRQCLLVRFKFLINYQKHKVGISVIISAIDVGKKKDAWIERLILHHAYIFKKIQNFIFNLYKSNFLLRWIILLNNLYPPSLEISRFENDSFTDFSIPTVVKSLFQRFFLFRLIYYDLQFFKCVKSSGMYWSFLTVWVSVHDRGAWIGGPFWLSA